MQEVMTDFALSIKIDNALLLEEVSDDNSYHFENEEYHTNWLNEIIREIREK